MPEMDGFALAQAVRENPSTAAIPVIGLSSSLHAETSERGARVGLRNLVAKFDRRGLVAALQQHDEQRQQLKCA